MGPRQQGPLPRRPPAQRLPGPRARVHDTWPEGEAKAALERSGYASLEPGLPIFTTDSWVNAKDGFRFRPPRLVEMAPRVYVAQGYDFADIGFVLTGAGIVAIDAGTTRPDRRAGAGRTADPVNAAPIPAVIVTHAHWDHIGGSVRAYRLPAPRYRPGAALPTSSSPVQQRGVPFHYFFGESARVPSPSARIIRPPAGDGCVRRHAIRPRPGAWRRDRRRAAGASARDAGSSSSGTRSCRTSARRSPPRVDRGLSTPSRVSAPSRPNGSSTATPAHRSTSRSRCPAARGRAGRPPRCHRVRYRTMAVPSPEFSRKSPSRRRSAAHPDAVVPPFLPCATTSSSRIYQQAPATGSLTARAMEISPGRSGARRVDLSPADASRRSWTRRVVESARRFRLALRVADLGLPRIPSAGLTELRRRVALEGLRASHQQLNPFKFIIYSDMGRSGPPAGRMRRPNEAPARSGLVTPSRSPPAHDEVRRMRRPGGLHHSWGRPYSRSTLQIRIM